MSWTLVPHFLSAIWSFTLMWLPRLCLALSCPTPGFGVPSLAFWVFAMLCSLLWGPPCLPPLGFSRLGDADLSLRCCANRAIYHFVALSMQTSLVWQRHSLALQWILPWLWLSRHGCTVSTSCVCGWPTFSHQFVCTIQATVLDDRYSVKIMLLRAANHPLWKLRAFDSTLGYPGEGPPQLWSILSSNIGSFFKDDSWKGWSDTFVCLQETRIGRNNFRNATKAAGACGKNLFLGDLLPGLFRCCHVGPQSTCRSF